MHVIVICHCRLHRPTKFPFGLLTHGNKNSLQLIVQTDTLCAFVYKMTFFLPKEEKNWISQRKCLWKWVTSVGRPPIGWKCWCCLSQLPVTMNADALRTNGRAVVRMQQWSRKKQPIVPGTLEKCDLPPAGFGPLGFTVHWRAHYPTDR